MTFSRSSFPRPGHARLHVAVIGAGVGGLASAIRLASAGFHVTMIERHGHVGGKIRTLPSAAGPVDAGPTVLTMRHVFDDLFSLAGARLDDHVTLVPQDILARHVWPDGSQLDLFADPDQSAAAINAFAGPKAERQFRSFCTRAATLFQAFDAPMMQTPAPRLGKLTRHVMPRPKVIGAMAPLSTLATMLRRHFTDPRLAQLFGRYATYVGGSPFQSPAVLALIWHAEASGVWVVKGGMHKLAGAMSKLATALGVEICLNTHVDRIDVQDGRARAIVLADGIRLQADAILFNGDPRALAVGSLGADCRGVARQTLRLPRSYSARVHSFAATPIGRDLAHHNVFFDADPISEFRDLHAGRLPQNPSIYICAEDRGQDQAPPPLERFEIITNAPAGIGTHTDKELDEWHEMIIQKIQRFNLSFTPTPTSQTITTPTMFDAMFPQTLGALYGQSPHGMRAAFQRPTARTGVPGLYLAGGGAHPGAGVPMATVSARHAAEAISSDLTSTSGLGQMAMHGGMSTG